MHTYSNYPILEQTAILKKEGYKLLGYSWLCDTHGIEPLNTIKCNVIAKDHYEYKQASEDDWFIKNRPGSAFDENYDTMGNAEHVIFAISGEDFSPYILKKTFSLFTDSDKSKFENMINNSPESAFGRKAGYLYEKITGDRLEFTGTEILNARRRSVENLLNPDKYYTITNVPEDRINQKYRVVDNTLGDLSTMCPIVKKTELLKDYSSRNYGAEMLDIFKKTDSALLDEAKKVMYIKESMMSFRLEGDDQDSKRIKAYEQILLANKDGFKELSKTKLINIQNRIVNDLCISDDYRDKQNFVGTKGREDSVPTVSYVSPAPKDVSDLMDGVLTMHSLMSQDTNIDPVVAGSVIHAAFAAVHPFEDGNGRISRLCFHDMLAKHHYVPDGAIFPISDIIVNKRTNYIKGLEDVTFGITKRCAFEADENNYITVTGNDPDLYRYLDVTPFAEAMYSIMQDTVDLTMKDVLKEANLILKVKNKIKTIVPGMSPKQIGKYCNLAVLDDGRVSNRLKQKLFPDISEESIVRLQAETKKIILDMEKLTDTEYCEPSL